MLGLITEEEKLKRREYYKRWKAANPDYFLNYQRTHRPAIRAANQRQYQAKKEKYNAKSRAWSKANSEKANVMTKRWQKANQVKKVKTECAWAKIQRRINPLYKAIVTMRQIANRARTRRCWSIQTQKAIGCDRDWFMAWMEVQFQPGMTWLNHGEWHVDHIRPLSSFDLLNFGECLKANHWTNLQPLWAVENLRKSNK